MSTNDGAGFEQSEDGGGYLQAPSPKRVRYDHQNGETAEVVQVVETLQNVGPNEVVGDETVTITVPSSQFEIEINSQVEEEENDEIPQLQRGDLTGPTFDIVHDQQELSASIEEAAQIDEGGTLNAIGRALLQMQQGSQTHSSPITTTSNQQMFLTSTEADNRTQLGTAPPLYVMIPPASSAEILQAMGQTRPIAPKTTSISLNMSQEDVNVDPSSREAQRKATHNEVERRRRDRINALIKTLAMVVPGCQKKDATTGTIVGYVYSKGTVLDKTVEYLKELITQNEQLAGTAKLAEKSANALSLLQNQITVLEKENAFLRAQIIQFGIDAAASSSLPSNVNRPIINSPLAQSLLNTVVQTSQTAPTPVAPQAPPSLPPQNPGGANTQAAAQQLLLSLAQTLTNSPLLTSLAQNPGGGIPAPPSIMTTPSRLNVSPAGLTVTATPTRLATTAHVSAPMTPQQQQQQQPTGNSPSPVTLQQQPPPVAVGGSPSQVAPLINSLVQSLASIANTTTVTTPSPLPKASTPINITPTSQAMPPQTQPPNASGGLSAAAAASLLKTLYMAQNVLTNNSAAGSQGGGVPMGDAGSVLSSIGLETVSKGE